MKYPIIEYKSEFDLVLYPSSNATQIFLYDEDECLYKSLCAFKYSIHVYTCMSMLFS